MSFKFNISTLDSPEAGSKLKETILTSEPNAKVEVDSGSKTVTIESQASEETFRQIITAARHKIA